MNKEPTMDSTKQTPELPYYDAGLLSDFGGGNVEWWQDYIRTELGRAHEFYQSHLDSAAQEPAPADVERALEALDHVETKKPDLEQFNAYSGTYIDRYGKTLKAALNRPYHDLAENDNLHEYDMERALDEMPDELGKYPSVSEIEAHLCFCVDWFAEHYETIRASLKRSAENERLRTALQTISDQGYFSAKFNTAEQLQTILDEHKELADAALSDTAPPSGEV